MEKILMKCQILFSVRNKKNSINLSSTEFAQRVEKVKIRANWSNISFCLLGILIAHQPLPLSWQIQQMITKRYFSHKIGFDISCKLSPKKTICMQLQILFSWGNKKKIIIQNVVS